MSPGSTGPFLEEDIQQARLHGLQEAQLAAQLELLLNPPAPVKLMRACTVGHGIRRLDFPEARQLEEIQVRHAAQGRCMKFVPASGSASRMFSALIAHWKDKITSLEQVRARAERADPNSLQVLEFLQGLERLPFYEQLLGSLPLAGSNPAELLGRGSIGELLEGLLGPRGMGYEDLPKALVSFHKYGEEVRTSLEEHLVEAAFYVADQQGFCKVHFTVSPAHLERFKARLEHAEKHYGEKLGVNFQIQVSVQEPCTDTLALDMGNRPFRDPEGRLVLRPGGHGALLKNLQETQGDIVFIKNIDNVPHGRFLEQSVFWKRVLAGCLIKLQEEIFELIELLEHSCPGESSLRRAMEYAEAELCLVMPPRKEMGTRQEASSKLRQWLDRPLRVCGMVENKGEPGGGPFWVKVPPGECPLQIVESVEVDLLEKTQRAIWASSTHFNPVDMVCGLRDKRGKPYDLRLFVDSSRVLITKKSTGGRELKALEHPGLWNGGMARWNTVFVEVPVSTFQPVKTVNDLLRPGHQPSG